MQSTQLYLDTARLGRMSPGAQKAHLDFTRLAGEEGGSLFFERFLREGSQAWSSPFRSQYSGLACWQGISHLKENLRTLAKSCPTLPVLMVNRSAQLMKFAARLLFHRCRNVLVTDLGWPPYHDILENEAQRAGRGVTSQNLRTLICNERTTEDTVIDAIRQRFQQAECDGLFLTAVSHLGFRLPAERLVRALEAVRELRFVVIDGAQDFCHAGADLGNEYCDLYLASCHKWLQGFHPMGLGFYGRHKSRGMIETVLGDLLATRELDDPMLRFTTQLEAATLDGETETVNLIPLFTWQGAAADTLASSSPSVAFSRRQKNLAAAAAMAEACGWHSFLSAQPFRTGILLLKAQRVARKNVSGRYLREAFANNGIALTAYDGGMVRLSMPEKEWPADEMQQLGSALRAVA